MTTGSRPRPRTDHPVPGAHATPRRFRGVIAVALATLLLASLAGCSGGSDTTTITVYSGRTEELIRPLLERFSKETGIGIDFKAGDTADLALLLATEKDKSPADVFIAQSPGAVAFLEAKGLLRPLSAETTGKVDAAYRSPKSTWVGLSGRVRCLVYNTTQVQASELPASVFDVTGPAYRGKVGVAPTNGSFQDFVSAMRADKGDDATRAWLAALKANDAKTYANNTAIVEAVGRGEIQMGLVNHYYNVRKKIENPSVASENYFFPDRDLGSLLLVTAAAITTSSTKVPEAERLVQFLLAAEAQKYFADETDEYPLAAGVKPVEALTPLSALSTKAVDFEALGGGFEQTIAMIKESGLAAS